MINQVLKTGDQSTNRLIDCRSCTRILIIFTFFQEENRTKEDQGHM